MIETGQLHIMKLRQSEYLENGIAARWLDPARSKNAYDYALQFTARDRYGLSEVAIDRIERVIIESYPVADAWLKDRLPTQGSLQIVYGDDEVCVVPAVEFLAKWQDIFVPARDDAVILHGSGTEILFYCHEEELEFGHRKT